MIHKVVSILYAMRFHGSDAILDWPGLAHFALMSCVQFFLPGSLYLFCDTLSQMKRWQFSVYHLSGQSEKLNLLLDYDLTLASITSDLVVYFMAVHYLYITFRILSNQVSDSIFYLEGDNTTPVDIACFHAKVLIVLSFKHVIPIKAKL